MYTLKIRSHLTRWKVLLSIEYELYNIEDVVKCYLTQMSFPSIQTSNFWLVFETMT